MRAPIDGHVSRAIITAGNLVTTSSVLTTVVSDDPVYAYFDADEQSFLRYRRWKPVLPAKTKRHGRSAPAASSWAWWTRTATRIRASSISSTTKSTPTTGTIRARAVFDNKDGRHTPGLFARIRLVGGGG